MTAAGTDFKTWLTIDECIDRAFRGLMLERLATKVAARQDIPDAEIERLLATYAHRSLTAEQANEAFDDHVSARRRLAQLDAGDITWADVNENLTGPDRTGWAREHLDMQAEDAMDVLLRGRKWA
jgi:hypothetical protein